MIFSEGIRNSLSGAVLGVVSLLLPLQGLAESDVIYDQVSLSSEAQGKVENDLLIAELTVRAEARTPSELANKVNAAMQWALDKLNRYPTLESQTRDYRTWPKYESKTNRIIGWEATQQLYLESDDFDTARDAIQILQEKLLIGRMELKPKLKTRQAVEDDLMREALKGFQSRAKVVQQTLGFSGYRIMNLAINRSGRQPPGQPRLMAKTAEMAAGPAIEGGSTLVTVHVNGSIQLQ